MITQEIVVTDQDALKAIDRITGDDFCADLDMRAAFHPETLSEFEKTAHAKLGLIYQLAHAFNRENSCFRVHDDWRKLVWPVPQEPEV